MKNKIIKFWDCSINNRMDEFDFNSFFEEFNLLLEHKLASHGQLSFNDYVSSLRYYYNLNLLKKFVYKGEHSGINEDYEYIIYKLFNKRYLIFQNNYNNKRYKNLLKLYLKLKDIKQLNQTEKVILVDECINIQHNSGFITGLDINKLREDFERK